MPYKLKSEIEWYQDGELATGTFTSSVPDGVANRPLEDLFDNTDFIRDDLATNYYTKTEVDSLVSGAVGGITTVHNDLTGLQGGTTGEFFHLTSAQHSDLIGTSQASQNASISSNSSTISNHESRITVLEGGSSSSFVALPSPVHLNYYSLPDVGNGWRPITHSNYSIPSNAALYVSMTMWSATVSSGTSVGVPIYLRSTSQGTGTLSTSDNRRLVADGRTSDASAGSGITAVIATFSGFLIPDDGVYQNEVRILSPNASTLYDFITILGYIIP